MGNNLAPSWKRAVGMAFVNSGGNLGGLVGSNIFLEGQAPRYPLGYGLCVRIVAPLVVAVQSTDPYVCSLLYYASPQAAPTSSKS